MQKRTARIEDWARLGHALVGVVFYDRPRAEFSPGEFLRTSRIVKLNERARICETRNTVYRLGAAFRQSQETSRFVPSEGSLSWLREGLKRILVMLVALCSLTGTLLAADDPFVGRWKVNPAKSHVAGAQLKIEDLGSNRFTITSHNISSTFTADGTDQPDPFGTTTSISPEGSNALRMIVKRDGKVTQSMTLTLSSDGMMQTVKGANTTADGSTSDFEIELKRVSSGSGWTGTWEEVQEKTTSAHELDIETYQSRGLTFKSPDYLDVVNMRLNGKNYEQVGPDEFSGKRVDEHTLELIYKVKGHVLENRTYQVSPDGRTLTITTHESGNPQDEVEVCDRL